MKAEVVKKWKLMTMGLVNTGLLKKIELPRDLGKVPEPSTMLLLGSGLAGLVGYGMRRLKP